MVYPVKFSGVYPIRHSQGARYSIPVGLRQVITALGAQSFDTNLEVADASGEDYSCLKLALRADEGGACKMVNGKIMLPKRVRDALAVNKKAYFVLTGKSTELWGPDWEKYSTTEHKDSEFANDVAAAATGI